MEQDCYRLIHDACHDHPVVAGFEWKIILDNHFGPLNYILDFSGFSLRMAVEAYACNGICLIMDTWQWTPFVAVVLLAGLAAIPRQVYEASSVDGSFKRDTMAGNLASAEAYVCPCGNVSYYFHIQNFRPCTDSLRWRPRYRNPRR